MFPVWFQLVWMVVGPIGGICLAYVLMMGTADGSTMMGLRKLLSPAIKPLLVIRCWFVRVDPENIVGYKWAYLLADFDTPFKALKWEERYRVHDRASCAKGRRHEPLASDDCNCGFYALKRRRHLGWVVGGNPDNFGWHERALVTLEVHLRYKIVEGRLGFRGRGQHVFRVIVPSKCVLCREKWYQRKRRAAGIAHCNDRMVPVCNDCHAQPHPLEWLASRLHTEVVWAQKRRR